MINTCINTLKAIRDCLYHYFTFELGSTTFHLFHSVIVTVNLRGLTLLIGLYLLLFETCSNCSSFSVCTLTSA